MLAFIKKQQPISLSYPLLKELNISNKIQHLLLIYKATQKAQLASFSYSTQTGDPLIENA